MSQKLSSILATLALSAGLSTTALAAPITFLGTVGTRSASVTFDVSGNDLKVTLANTSALDALVPTDILTGVFFKVSVPLSVSPLSAVLSPGSTVVNAASQPPGGVVGGEWAYRTGILDQNAWSGISSSGLGLFGPGDRFAGANLEGPDSPDGIQYGITTAGDIAATGNGGINGSGLIKNSVDFVLDGLPLGFDLESITAVVFQYGTALTEPQVPGNGCVGVCSPGEVPEPSSAALLALGLFGLGAVARVRPRRAPPAI